MIYQTGKMIPFINKKKNHYAIYSIKTRVRPDRKSLITTLCLKFEIFIKKGRQRSKYSAARIHKYKSKTRFRCNADLTFLSVPTDEKPGTIAVYIFRSRFSFAQIIFVQSNQTNWLIIFKQYGIL